MKSKNKILAATGLIFLFLIVGSHMILSGRAEGDIKEEEAKRIAEEECGGVAKGAKAISANRETDEGSDNAYYDVIVENDEGYWEVEVYCKDGSIGEKEGPTITPEVED